jgi:hypothetical protein
VHDFHAAVAVLDDAGATVHPVAAVDIGNAIDLANGSGMDVAADHAIEVAVPDAAHHGLLEVAKSPVDHG